jgi:hypothetical protein
LALGVSGEGVRLTRAGCACNRLAARAVLLQLMRQPRALTFIARRSSQRTSCTSDLLTSIEWLALLALAGVVAPRIPGIALSASGFLGVASHIATTPEHIAFARAVFDARTALARDRQFDVVLDCTESVVAGVVGRFFAAGALDFALAHLSTQLPMGSASVDFRARLSALTVGAVLEALEPAARFIKANASRTTAARRLPAGHTAIADSRVLTALARGDAATGIVRGGSVVEQELWLGLPRNLAPYTWARKPLPSA